jgi:hypothetical protein
MVDKGASHSSPNGGVSIQHRARAATRHVHKAEHLAVDLPFVGTVQLPRADQLAYFAAVGLLVAFEVIDWPVALVLAAGHALATQQHNRALQEFGEGLEIAEE